MHFTSKFDKTSLSKCVCVRVCNVSINGKLHFFLCIAGGVQAAHPVLLVKSAGDAWLMYLLVYAIAGVTTWRKTTFLHTVCLYIWGGVGSGGAIKSVNATSCNNVIATLRDVHKARARAAREADIGFFQVRHALLEFSRNVRRRNGQTQKAGIQILDKCWDYCKDFIPKQINTYKGSKDHSLEWGLVELDLLVAVAIQQSPQSLANGARGDAPHWKPLTT